MNEEKYPEIMMPQCQAEKILTGQKTLVTGGSSGIGKAVAIELGRAGADVVVNYLRGEGQAQEVVAEIEKNGSHALAYQADVSQEDQVIAMFEKRFKHQRFTHKAFAVKLPKPSINYDQNVLKLQILRSPIGLFEQYNLQWREAGPLYCQKTLGPARRDRQALWQKIWIFPAP